MRENNEVYCVRGRYLVIVYCGVIYTWYKSKHQYPVPELENVGCAFKVDTGNSIREFLFQYLTFDPVEAPRLKC